MEDTKNNDDIITTVDFTEKETTYLAYKKILLKKKNEVRKELAKRGVQPKKGHNDFDKYDYFTESQYKELFTELFSKHGLELSFDEDDYKFFEGSGKQPNGRLVKLTFELTDIETGFSEYTTISAEGMDKGDKAGYKAYTGALKYYLANTFMVATGDSAEAESPETTQNAKPAEKKSAKETDAVGPTDNQINLMRKMCEEAGATFDETAARKMTREQASKVISMELEKKKKKGEADGQVDSDKQ